MHQIQFLCPACKFVSDVSVESASEVIVMACAHCKTPLMWYHGEVFEVDSIEIADLQQKHLKAVEGYLKVHDLKQTVLGLQSISGDPHPPATHRRGEPVRKDFIDSDSIADLLIDLETCESVDDFLERI
ncbi:MAG: hypothetical protein GX801_09165 [Fibrobacter sp.]|nr:hypothetical protein [Fibrobacter sp.]